MFTSEENINEKIKNKLFSSQKLITNLCAASKTNNVIFQKPQCVCGPRKYAAEILLKERLRPKKKIKPDLAMLRLNIQQQQRTHKTVMESQRLCRNKMAAFDTIRRE